MTAPRPPRRPRAPFVLGLAGVLTVAGGVLWFQAQPSAQASELGRLAAGSAALQSLAWPEDFTPVAVADGCITAPGTICLATDRDPATAAAVVAELISGVDVQSRAGLPGAPADSTVMVGTVAGWAVSAAVDAHRLSTAEVSPGEFSGGSTVSVGLAGD